MVPDYTTPTLYRTKESVFLRGAASPPPYISLVAPVFSHELLPHDLESDESLCVLGLRVVRGAVQDAAWKVGGGQGKCQRTSAH